MNNLRFHITPHPADDYLLQVGFSWEEGPRKFAVGSAIDRRKGRAGLVRALLDLAKGTEGLSAKPKPEPVTDPRQLELPAQPFRRGTFAQ